MRPLPVICRVPRPVLSEGMGIKAYGPKVARAQLVRLIHGNTPAIQAAARTVLGPRIAKQITQKAIIKTAVPIVGTAISAGWNYATTRMMGTRARHGVRVTAALRERDSTPARADRKE